MISRLKKTLKIPANRRVSFNLPKTFIPGQFVTLTVNPSHTHKIKQKKELPSLLSPEEFATGVECPVCKYHNYTPNAKTIEAIEEGEAILRDEIPGICFDSPEEMFRYLKS